MCFMFTQCILLYITEASCWLSEWVISGPAFLWPKVQMYLCEGNSVGTSSQCVEQGGRPGACELPRTLLSVWRTEGKAPHHHFPRVYIKGTARAKDQGPDKHYWVLAMCQILLNGFPASPPESLWPPGQWLSPFTDEETDLRGQIMCLGHS